MLEQVPTLYAPTIPENAFIDKLIDRLADHLSAIELVVLKALIDALIKYLNGLSDQTSENHSSKILDAIALPTLFSATNVSHVSLKSSLVELLDFIIQLGYQHTSAYGELLGTTLFGDLVKEIKVKLANGS